MISRLLFVFIALLFVADVSAQRRDYLTPAEADAVRNNQEIDTRIAVLTYAIDRRFTAMGVDAKGPKKPIANPESTDNDWGAEPRGSKGELLGDISHLLEKAIDDIDNLAGHLPEKAKEERKGVNLFNKAVKSLDASARRWLPLLKREFETAQDEATHAAAATSIDLCEQIIDAATKLK